MIGDVFSLDLICWNIQGLDVATLVGSLIEDHRLLLPQRTP